MNNDKLEGLNWIGAGFSLAWIAFFITCMFIRTNLPDSAFADRFLADGRVVWTLAGSFLAALALATATTSVLKKLGFGECQKGRKQ